MTLPASLRTLLAAPARAPVLPGGLRASYALVLKRLFALARWPALARIDGVGTMKLEPWDLIDSRLYFFDVWEPALTRLIRSAVQPGQVVADIGANIGYFTLMLSRAVGPEGRVYAIEPSPEIRVRLDDTLRRNGCDNVIVVPYGISDRAERRAFTVSTTSLGASRFGEPSADGLELRRLADAIPASDLSRLSFIKIDVEGMEDAVMRDLAALLPVLPQQLTICAELRIDAAMRETLAPFRDAGFRFHHIPNRYTMFDYPNHPTATEPCSDLPDGQADFALVR